MSICPHCKGTGEAPGVANLECIGCQRKVKIIYTSAKELMDKCVDVYCADCKRTQSTPPE